MPGCDFVARAESEAALLETVAKHAREVHGIQEVTPDLATKVKGVIKDA